MKITGEKSYIYFDLENDYTLKAEGELLYNNTFIVFKDSMEKWDPHHENEELSNKQIDEIIIGVKKCTKRVK
ncbi:Imm74 family immunity protein [Candidatus Stoquefichus massiliensis]|uniref:Imm74 family immunity protein n=1 Tax=Candidatus Stoquefichus massiliensis TaxID=1470350 RepID=UPI000484F71B|nr:Imm74 family immunity protein [Candidatus Stoquefichus massiliensis]